MLASLLEKVGAKVLKFTDQVGDFSLISARAFAAIFQRPFDIPNLMNQLVAVGFNSIPIVLMTSLAVSMVFGLQLAHGFKQFRAEALASQVEGLAVVRELAPVITGLMMAGRAGSAMAAELGTMQVTEQVDALECLATDPIHYLFVPRLLACSILLPLLTAFAIYVGFWGGYIMLVGVEGQSAYVYSNEFYKLLSFRDVRIALTKGLTFGILIALVGCWRGYRTRGGAEGVGNAPTSSVVTSSLSILIADFFLTKLLLMT